MRTALNRKKRLETRRTLALLLWTAFTVALVPGPAQASHRLRGNQCQDCHTVSGSINDVVGQTRLIRKDPVILQYIANGWSPGTNVPCTYCHDAADRALRTNMVPVLNDFINPISKHQVDPWRSNNQFAATGLDCLDCHDNVDYVGMGAGRGSTINPNIHGHDVGAVGWTAGNGSVRVDSTYVDGYSPYNADGNAMCLRRCHDGVDGTGYDADQAAHGYTSPLVSLELESGFFTRGDVNGCLDGGGVGCHSVHRSQEGTDLITARKDDGTVIGRSDCGSCHMYDDPPYARGNSFWFVDGHGRFATTSGITCVSCHDPAAPHFAPDGGPAGNRLSFVEDAVLSGFSSPPKSVESICVSSNCHAGKTAHSSRRVGCLDCHAPHGYGALGNMAMVRRDLPLASPTAALYYTGTGNYFASGTPPGTFSNRACDQQDCHGGAGPGPYSSLAAVGHTNVTGGCDACHRHEGNAASWAPSCDDCHGYPPTGGVPHGSGLTAPLDPPGFLGAHDQCLVCHGKTQSGRHPNYLSSFHSDGSVTMNADLQYDGNGGCDAACHPNDANHRMAASATYGANAGSFGYGSPASCRFCHETGLYGAVVIASASAPHLDPDGSGTAWAVGDCKGCHAGHVGSGQSVTIPLPPSNWNDPSGRLTGANMRTQLGIAYAGHGGVSLGGVGTAAAAYTTEAQVCWGCHVQRGVSEWGYNTKTNPTLTGFAQVWSAFATSHDGTGESKDYGWIYQSNYSTKVTDWTAGHWKDEYDSLTRRRIASVHSANFDTAGQSSSVAANVVAATGRVRQGTNGNPNGDASEPVLEARRSIRCSYCHDVHNTFGPGGKPYLRGTWIGDPYPPAIPPRSTYTYTTTVNQLGSPVAPRALSTARNRGGYFIDQNSGWPTNNAAMDTLSETAGLCSLCHGADVNTMDYYTGSSMWRFAPPAKNGHSNSALGGTRNASLISDLFTAARYGYGMGMQASVPTTPWVCGMYGSDCDYNYPMAGWFVGMCSTSCENMVNSGWFGGAVGTGNRDGGDYANWYGTGTIGGASTSGSMAHKFTCSKCHSPHATGLPALLVHNCIDPAAGSWSYYSANGVSLIANNCHRKTTTTDGWHILAPRQ